MFPKIVVPPKSSILIGGSPLFSLSILGYLYFWKHPHLHKNKDSLILKESQSWACRTIFFASTPRLNSVGRQESEAFRFLAFLTTGEVIGLVWLVWLHRELIFRYLDVFSISPFVETLVEGGAFFVSTS